MVVYHDEVEYDIELLPEEELAPLVKLHFDGICPHERCRDFVYELNRDTFDRLADELCRRMQSGERVLLRLNVKGRGTAEAVISKDDCFHSFQRFWEAVADVVWSGVAVCDICKRLGSASPF